MEQTTQPIEQEPKVKLYPPADEVFRGVWTSLFYAGRGMGKISMVCGGDRLEGASTVACGLALAGSEGALARIALVDMNLRFPAVHHVLGLDQSPGVGEVLFDGLDIASAANSVNPALDVFTIGTATGKILDVLRGRGMAQFLDKLSAQYDYVLADVAAANAYPDAQALVAAIPQVILVAHAGQTPREAVAQAKKRLEAAGGKILGLVLNMRTYPIPRFLYRRV